MGAKDYAAATALSVLALAGCSDIERFAPPGVVKYENLAGDEPIDPIIQERVAERRAAGAGGYPDLSKAPTEAPDKPPQNQIDASAAAIREARDALAATVEDDRVSAGLERESSFVLPGESKANERTLEEARDELQAAVEKADEEARRERGLPPRQRAVENE